MRTSTSSSWSPCSGAKRFRQPDGAAVANADEQCLVCDEEDQFGQALRPSGAGGGSCVACPGPRMVYSPEARECVCKSSEYFRTSDGQCFAIINPANNRTGRPELSYGLNYENGINIGRSAPLVRMLETA